MNFFSQGRFRFLCVNQVKFLNFLLLIEVFNSSEEDFKFIWLDIQFHLHTVDFGS